MSGRLVASQAEDIAFYKINRIVNTGHCGTWIIKNDKHVMYLSCFLGEFGYLYMPRATPFPCVDTNAYRKYQHKLSDMVEHLDWLCDIGDELGDDSE